MFKMFVPCLCFISDRVVFMSFMYSTLVNFTVFESALWIILDGIGLEESELGLISVFLFLILKVLTQHGSAYR